MTNKKQQKIALEMVYPESRTTTGPYQTITYFGDTSERVGKILKNQGINIAFKPAVKLGSLLLNHKNKTEKKKQSGVYKLQCGECRGIYIGQTGRSFEVRRAEHFRSLRLKKSDSNYANHLLETGHKPNQNMEILHIAEKGHRLNCWEALEIYKNKNGPDILLNDQTDIFCSTLFQALPTLDA